MSKKMKVGFLVGVFLITAFAFAENSGQLSAATVSVAAGQPATAAALPETPTAKAAAPAPKKPALGITYGWDGRFRTDALNNYDFTNNADDEGRYLRWRNRLFMNVNLGENVDGFIRMANEPWKRWMFNGLRGIPWSGQDIWIDNAYLDFKKLPIKGMSLKVGRQDIVRGDGILSVFTGEGGLGPKAGGFDAFILGYSRGKQKFELMGFWNPEMDDFYPVINQKFPAIPAGGGFPGTPSGAPQLNEMGNVQAIGVYYTNRQFKNTDIDAFSFFTKEYDMLKFTKASSYQYQPDRHFMITNGRIVQRFPQNVIVHANVSGEFGTQDAMSSLNSASFGSFAYPQADIRAWAFYGFATKYFQMKTKPYVRVVSELLSGQDPKSKTDGSYDQWTGRYTGHPSPFIENGYASPIFSDNVPNETRGEQEPAPAGYQNLKLIGAEAGFTPLQGKLRKLQLAVAYQHANAFHPFTANPVHYSAPGTLLAGTSAIPAYFSTTGLGRYQLVKADLRYVATKNILGFLSFEREFYGDFYNQSWVSGGKTFTRANAYMFRSEINYRFSGFLPFHKIPKV